MSAVFHVPSSAKCQRRVPSLVNDFIRVPNESADHEGVGVNQRDPWIMITPSASFRLEQFSQGARWLPFREGIENGSTYSRDDIIADIQKVSVCDTAVG